MAAPQNDENDTRSVVANLAELQRTELEKNNYVVTAKPEGEYWHGWDENVVRKYLKASEGNFHFIIIGSSKEPTDFYCIPYRVVQNALSAETLANGTRRRWTAQIRHHQLKIRNWPAFDIAQWYGAPALLFEANASFGARTSQADENEYAIENRKAEIAVRLKQSKFREAVLANFGFKCCLSGVSEPDLLVASHIVPWAKRVSSRLDPSNGLCLFTLYDRFFDQGYISVNDELRVIITPKFQRLSEPVQQVLARIDGVRIRPSIHTSINLEYLAYHRTHVFR